MTQQQFDNSIKKLSKSQKTNEIPLEWKFINRDKCNNKCLCGRNIDYCNYYYNDLT